MNMRKTKIICTLGPAVDHAETIEQLIRTGMNAARFNFSHGSHAEQLARLNMFKKVRDTLGAPVATILDTKGPEIRIKTFADGPVTLEQGQGFILTTDDVPGDGHRVSCHLCQPSQGGGARLPHPGGRRPHRAAGPEGRGPRHPL